MQFSSVILAFAAAATVSAGAVTSIISPTGAAPAGCTGTYNGDFEITVVKPQAKREVQEKRAACGGTGTLVISLTNGIMTDAMGRTGYIASNYQFQFDKPPQAGALTTAGFSVCGNSSIALGDTTVFYQCQSGGFYNLYNKDWAAQCEPVAIDVVPCGGSTVPSVGTSSVASTVAATGSVAASTPAASAPVVSQQTDGQPTATSAIMVSQYTDGQPQVPTALVSQITDGQPQAGTATPTIVQGAAATHGALKEIVIAGAALAGAALL